MCPYVLAFHLSLAHISCLLIPLWPPFKNRIAALQSLSRVVLSGKLKLRQEVILERTQNGILEVGLSQIITFLMIRWGQWSLGCVASRWLNHRRGDWCEGQVRGWVGPGLWQSSSTWTVWGNGKCKGYGASWLLLTALKPEQKREPRLRLLNYTPRTYCDRQKDSW